MSFILPISAFILLLVSSWDWVFENQSMKPTKRGAIAIICGIIGLTAGWAQYISDAKKIESENIQIRELLTSIEREGRRLQPTDFQIKITASAHLAAFRDSPNYSAPERMDLFVSIGSILITGQYQNVPKSTPGVITGRNPSKRWDYNGNGLFIEGLNENSYLDDLAGKTIKIYFPRLALGRPFSSKLSTIQGNISIKGREFLFQVIHKGTRSVDILIPKDYVF